MNKTTHSSLPPLQFSKQLFKVFPTLTLSSCLKAFQSKISIPKKTMRFLWINGYLSGVHGSHDHFKANPTRMGLGKIHQNYSHQALFTEWKTFVLWFWEYSKCYYNLLVFTSPLLNRYGTLMTLGSTSLSINEWANISHIVESNIQRHGGVFNFFFKISVLKTSHLFVFPDAIFHHATISNLKRKSVFTVGVLPLSYPSYNLHYPLYVFELTFNLQLFFLNLLRYITHAVWVYNVTSEITLQNEIQVKERNDNKK